MTTTSISESVKIFLAKEPIYSGMIPSGVGDDFPLIESGALDSIGIFSLVSFLETKFSISVDAQDLIEANFKSVRAIEAFVRSRQK